MYLKSTGISHSHTLRLLSSEVVTKRLLLSTNVMVLTAPKWRSYSWTISLLLMSHCRSKGRLWNFKGLSFFLNFKACYIPSSLWFYPFKNLVKYITSTPLLVLFFNIITMSRNPNISLSLRNIGNLIAYFKIIHRRKR